MRAVIQRVSEASVRVDGNICGAIGKGLLILLGVEEADTSEDVKWLASKIMSLRIFDDAAGVMNENILQVNGELLLISQFTLFASTKKGNRPSYIRAARPETAIPLYEQMIAALGELSPSKVQTGIFGADMKVSLVNDGPVTILMDTKTKE